MHPDSWPRRPCPESSGPRYEAEITDARELRSMRAGLRSWLSVVSTDDAARPVLLDELLLAVDELASNGLRHGGAPVRVLAAATALGLLLDVTDGDPDHGPEPATGRDPALGGMGLHMVAHVTSVRGWEPRGHHKHVWARLYPR